MRWACAFNFGIVGTAVLELVGKAICVTRSDIVFALSSRVFLGIRQRRIQTVKERLVPESVRQRVPASTSRRPTTPTMSSKHVAAPPPCTLLTFAACYTACPD